MPSLAAIALAVALGCNSGARLQEFNILLPPVGFCQIEAVEGVDLSGIRYGRPVGFASLQNTVIENRPIGDAHQNKNRTLDQSRAVNDRNYVRSIESDVIPERFSLAGENSITVAYGCLTSIFLNERAKRVRYGSCELLLDDQFSRYGSADCWGGTVVHNVAPNIEGHHIWFISNAERVNAFEFHVQGKPWPTICCESFPRQLVGGFRGASQSCRFLYMRECSRDGLLLALDSAYRRFPEQAGEDPQAGGSHEQPASEGGEPPRIARQRDAAIAIDAFWNSPAGAAVIGGLGTAIFGLVAIFVIPCGYGRKTEGKDDQ
jgi:hypothetical protein